MRSRKEQDCQARSLTPQKSFPREAPPCGEPDSSEDFGFRFSHFLPHAIPVEISELLLYIKTKFLTFSLCWNQMWIDMVRGYASAVPATPPVGKDSPRQWPAARPGRPRSQVGPLRGSRYTSPEELCSAVESHSQGTSERKNLFSQILTFVMFITAAGRRLPP